MPQAFILTAIPEEYRAVRDHLTDLRNTSKDPEKYEQGLFEADGSTWEVTIAQSGQGNVNAAIAATEIASATESALANFQPDIALFVGIAGGIPGKDVQLGDVIAVEEAYDYENSKIEKGKKNPRGGTQSSKERLIDLAKQLAIQEDWKKRIHEKKSHVNPKVLSKPVASGGAVVGSTESSDFQYIRDNFSDAVAVEKEGVGFLRVFRKYENIPAIVIRGISDLIDNKPQAEKEGYREIAASHASAFAFELLAKFDPSISSQQDSFTQRFSEELTLPRTIFDQTWVNSQLKKKVQLDKSNGMDCQLSGEIQQAIKVGDFCYVLIHPIAEKAKLLQDIETSIDDNTIIITIRPQDIKRDPKDFTLEQRGQWYMNLIDIIRSKLHQHWDNLEAQEGINKLQIKIDKEKLLSGTSYWTLKGELIRKNSEEKYKWFCDYLENKVLSLQTIKSSKLVILFDSYVKRESENNYWYIFENLQFRNEIWTMFQDFYENCQSNLDCNRLTFVIVDSPLPSNSQIIKHEPQKIAFGWKLSWGCTSYPEPTILIEQLNSQFEMCNSKAVFKRILDLIGVQPFHFQKICQHLFSLQCTIPKGKELKFVDEFIESEILNRENNK